MKADILCRQVPKAAQTQNSYFPKLAGKVIAEHLCLGKFGGHH